MDDTMEDMKRRVEALHNAVFGDPENHKNQPGMMSELAHLQKEQSSTNEVLRRIFWMVVASVVAGVTSIVLKH